MRWTEIGRLSLSYEGVEFGATGSYEWIFRRIAGSTDPEDARNAGIALLDKAPRDENGRVRYEADYTILKPVDLRRGNGWLLYHVLRTIEVTRAPALPFDRGAIYEFVYDKKDPVVMGLGLAKIFNII